MRGASGAYTGVGVAADALAVERQQALLDLADRCSSAFYTSTLEDKPWREERPVRRVRRDTARNFLDNGSPSEATNSRSRKVTYSVAPDLQSTLEQLGKLRRPSERMALAISRALSRTMSGSSAAADGDLEAGRVASLSSRTESVEPEQVAEGRRGRSRLRVMKKSPSWHMDDSDMDDVELDDTPTFAEEHSRAAELFLNPLLDNRQEPSNQSLSLDIRVTLMEKAYKITLRHMEASLRSQSRAFEESPNRVIAVNALFLARSAPLDGGSSAKTLPDGMETEAAQLDSQRPAPRMLLKSASATAARMAEMMRPSRSVQRAVQRTRHRLYMLFEKSESSMSAWCVSTLVIFTIIMSSASFCMETIQTLTADPYSNRALLIVEDISIVIFTIDVGVRTLCCPDLRRFLSKSMTAVDYAAIVPYYVELGLGGGVNGSQTRILRLVRIVRVVRILKLFRRFRRIKVVTLALTNSADMLFLLFLLVLLFMIVFSTMIYYCERGTFLEARGYYSRGMPFDTLCEDTATYPLTTAPFNVSLSCYPGETPFNSIPASAWWCVVTLLTIGYGDVVPFTPQGKVVAAVCMVFGLLLLSLPISVIGTQFTQEWLLYKSNSARRLELHRRAPHFNSLRTHLVEHDARLAQLLVSTRDVLFDIDNIRARLSDKQTRALAGGDAPRRLSRSSGLTGNPTLDVKNETQIIAMELDLKSKLLRLHELLAQGELLRSSEFGDQLRTCRTAYATLQQSAAAISGIVDDGDNVEQAMDDLLATEVRSEFEMGMPQHRDGMGSGSGSVGWDDTSTRGGIWPRASGRPLTPVRLSAGARARSMSVDSTELRGHHTDDH